jgi:hypothetical protein
MSHEHQNTSNDNVAGISFNSSIWLVVILAGLFVGALNFIQVVGKAEPAEGKKAETEMKAMPEKKAEEAKAPAAEAPKQDTMKKEAAPEVKQAEAPKMEP